MVIKRVCLFFALFALFLFSFPSTSKAVSIGEVISPENLTLLRLREQLQYFFAFKIENKVMVLEKHAEKRLVKAQNYADDGNNQGVQNMIQNYQEIKERQDGLLEKIDNKDIIDSVAQRTVEQQKTMETVKTRTDGDTTKQVIQVQERVVNQVAKHVVEVNGPEGTTQFLNEVVHVWAPGTGPGGEAGVVYAGGGKLIFAPGTGPGGNAGVVIEGGTIQFAPGTSAGGPSAPDIKTVEIKTGGTTNDTVQNDGTNLSPGTVNDSPGNTIDPGGVDSNGQGVQTINP